MKIWTVGDVEERPKEVTLDRLMITMGPLGDLLRRRVVLVTGKGGVGKTTVTAALARAAAATGKRVLAAEIASDEAAPSPLATALGAAASDDDPIAVAPGIRCVRISPSRGHKDFLREAMPVRFLADAAMRSDAIRQFLRAAPTFSEMGVLYRLLHLTRERRGDGEVAHEVVIVDLPATGHALALTQLPEAILRLIPGGPIVAAVRDGLALISDPELTATVVVTLPETLPVSETLELAAKLEKDRISVTAFVLNRAPANLFEEAERSFLDTWLSGETHVLGVRSLDRIDRAEKAKKRLRESYPGIIFQLPDLLDDDTLSTRLSVMLGSATNRLAEAPA
jgi:arsenite-transporting ATPase